MARAKKNAGTAALVDELGDLERELAPLEAKLSRVDTLRKQIRAMYANSTPSEAFALEGKRFVAQIGPRANERYVDVQHLAKNVMPEKLIALATVTVRALEGSGLPEILQAACIVSERTGTRRLSIEERGGGK